MGALKDPVLINLASNEYVKAIKPNQLKGRVVTIIFKEIKKSQSRVIAIFAKRARGMMTHYLIQNRIEAPERNNRFKWWDINFRKMTPMMKIGRLPDLSRNPEL